MKTKRGQLRGFYLVSEFLKMMNYVWSSSYFISSELWITALLLFLIFLVIPGDLLKDYIKRFSNIRPSIFLYNYKLLSGYSLPKEYSTLIISFHFSKKDTWERRIYLILFSESNNLYMRLVRKISLISFHVEKHVYWQGIVLRRLNHCCNRCRFADIVKLL